jgi:hypothetical protein
MNLSATFDDASKKKGWLALAGLVSVPVYVLPVGIWGVRALRPRLLRDFTRGALTLGMLSLLGMGVAGLARLSAEQAGPGERWKLPNVGPHMPEGDAASAASGH